jgi:hypothetical protein
MPAPAAAGHTKNNRAEGKFPHKNKAQQKSFCDANCAFKNLVELG